MITDAKLRLKVTVAVPKVALLISLSPVLVYQHLSSPYSNSVGYTVLIRFENKRIDHALGLLMKCDSASLLERDVWRQLILL